MWAHSQGVLFLLGCSSLVQAASFRYHDNKPEKRNFLDDILGAIGGGSDGDHGGAKTVTETLKATITVGGGAVLGGSNGTAVTQTVTVTHTAPAGAADCAAGTEPASGLATTVYNVAPPLTITQTSTVTMVQMIACGTSVGSPVPPEQASLIASSAASLTEVVSSAPIANTSAVVASSTAVVESSSMATTPAEVVSTSSAIASSTAVEATSAPAEATTASETAIASETAAPVEATSSAAETTSATASETVAESTTAAAETTSAAAVETTSVAESTTSVAETTTAAETVAEPTTTTADAAQTSIALPIVNGGSSAGTTPVAEQPGSGSNGGQQVPPAQAAVTATSTFSGVNEGPTVDLSGHTLTNALNLGNLGAAATTTAVGALSLGNLAVPTTTAAA